MGERSNPEVAAVRISECITNLLAQIQEYCWDFSVTSDLLELRNINTVVGLISRRGLHYNLDYPQPSEDWRTRDTIVRRTK